MTQEEFFKRYTYSPSRDRIGGGGFGTVYKAKDNVLHREVAIKVSEVKTSADGKKTFSLKDEFEALAHVPKHPNIANYEEFYSYESPQGLFDYAVMRRNRRKISPDNSSMASLSFTSTKLFTAT